MSGVIDKAGKRIGFSRLSTGIKMLLILTMALLPLGLIALLASIESAHKNSEQHQADARVIAETGARQIDETVNVASAALRRALASVAADPSACRATLDQADRVDRQPIAYALFDGTGRQRCATGGFVSPDGASATRSLPGRSLIRTPPMLRFVVAGRAGSVGVGELPVSAIMRLAGFGAADHALALADGDQSVTIVAGRRRLMDQRLATSAPIGRSGMRLVVTVHANTISATEILLVLLPLLMWAAAAIIGWLVVDRLLLRPLLQLQRVIAAYDPATGPLVIPRLTTPSHEIRSLGESFSRATRLIGQHETDLEEGLLAQKKLTREVHHRVKNNLQVIASLINLHARGASGGVAQAYASIQRRVDALAVVHRHHFAELEENRGVNLRALIGELVANLRATASPEVAGMTMALDVAPSSISQDVAVPVAFLITEIIELVMTCDPRGGVALSIVPLDDPGKVRLSVASNSLADERCSGFPGIERFNRVVTGLARQLRAPLDYDSTTGLYQIALPIVMDKHRDQAAAR